jgi:TolB protein
MKINGKPKGSADLKQGAVVLTKGEDSQADVCLQRGAIDCTVWGDSKIVVLPRELPDVIMQTVTKADVSCTATVKGTRKYLDVSHQKITLGALGLKPQQRPSMFSALGATAASAHVFTLSVRRARVVIKVRRGVTVVAPKNRLREGVVVGRNQQVTVQRGVPSEPTQSHETSRQRRQLDRYERRLPPPDTTAPSPFVIGPSNESSLRSPTFRFTSNEAGAVFSCSLNTPNDFRVCTDGQPFTHLPLGANHVFVKATDAAGNTTQHATRYDWFVEQNPIVYARGPAGGNTDIWTMDSDGANQKQLTHDSAHARTPEWSPDHTQIAFDSDVAGNYDIYVMSANGSKRQAVANDAVDERNPTWSPDGQEIAFERGPSGARDIYVISANGGRPRRLTSNQADDLDPAWSPDGQQIAFASTRGDNYDIYVINANGGQATDLTNTPDATEFGPAWSPSGDMIAFHRKVDRPVPVPNDIYVMNPDGSNQQKITQTGWDDVYPSWAPDGREIVFYSARVPESKDADIYFVSLDVKIEARLTNDADYDYLPDW